MNRNWNPSENTRILFVAAGLHVLEVLVGELSLLKAILNANHEGQRLDGLNPLKIHAIGVKVKDLFFSVILSLEVNSEGVELFSLVDPVNLFLTQVLHEASVGII